MKKDSEIQLRISSSDKEKLRKIAEKRHLKISELLDEYIQKLIKEDNPNESEPI